MAINKWVTVTLDPAATSKNDRVDHRNTSALTGADGGNVTVAIDTAVITRLTLLDSALATARQTLASQLPP
jgi:hypothetical protein